MDQGRVVKKLFNNYIVAVAVKEENKGVLYAPKMLREERYEKLKIVQGDDELAVDDIILVSYGKGTTVSINDVETVLINKREVICIL